MGRFIWLYSGKSTRSPLINSVLNIQIYSHFKQSAFPVLTALQVLSTVKAMYGFLLFAEICKEPLKEYKVELAMKLFQFVILFYTLQGNILNLLANYGVISCTDLLPAISTSSSKCRSVRYPKFCIV